jgi:hypothetical protein
MLLWPHELIPQDDFIEPHYDDVLLKQAVKKLSLFHFADVIENPNMIDNFHVWLGQPLTYATINETTSIPPRLNGFCTTS